jgi:DNA polymerase V
VEKHLVTDQIVLTIGYDIENLTDKNISENYKGEVTTDHYGRKVPKHAHGTGNLRGFSSSTKEIMAVVMELFDRIINESLLVRRVTICANHIVDESKAPREEVQQLDLFTDYETLIREEKEREAQLKKEKNMRLLVHSHNVMILLQFQKIWL